MSHQLQNTWVIWEQNNSVRKQITNQFITNMYILFKKNSKRIMVLVIKKYVTLTLLKISGNIGHLFPNQGLYS